MSPLGLDSGRLVYGAYWMEEACCREVNNRGWAIGWEEGDRKYRLERRLNEAGRFILCSVCDIE